MYLAWYDASKKLSFAEKVWNARQRYIQKFDALPTEVLVNPSQVAAALQGCNELVIGRSHIAPDCFWIGTSEDNT